MDKTYNGWTNYETWAVALWMDNEQGTQEYWREMAAECLDGAADEPTAIYTLSERVKEWHEEQEPGMPHSPGVFQDLLRAAMSEVNWYEIAKNQIGAVLEDRVWNLQHPQVKS